MTDRLDILETAKKLTGGDRNNSYGSPVKNMQETAGLWSAYMRTRGVVVKFSGEDVAHMMAMVKIARMKASLKKDNYDDAVAYIAIAGECAHSERSEK